MFFKKKVPYQAYCNSCLKAALDNTDEATLRGFQQACGDSALYAADHHIYQDHFRAIFIEMLLIAIAKNYPMMEVSLPAQMFLSEKLKELNLGEVANICHTYSQVFASPGLGDIASGTDGIRKMVSHFNNVVCRGQLKQETVDRLYGELQALLQSHLRDFTAIKLTR